MKNKIVLIALFVFANQDAFSQHSGNFLTNDNYTYNNQMPEKPVNRLYLSDSAFVIEARVLTNVIADSYVVTIGVSQYEKTLKEANTKINERIQKFISALKSTFEIPASDVYVDLTTQTQVADYKTNGNYAEQFISGVEQKKNVVVKLKKIEDLDKLCVLASEYEIYDLAKVDYILSDINRIYSELFSDAMEVINHKKDLFVAATNIQLKKPSQIFGESFYSFSPKHLYKRYTPNVTAEYDDYRSNTRIKDLRKNTTYYYDPVNYSGFDKVINPTVIEPAIEYVLVLQIKFDIVK